MSSKILLFFAITLVVVTIFTRFFNLDWGNGYYFHPDENNMAISVEQMRLGNLHPDFFAYGQFPLFLTFFTTPKHQFSSIILTLRFWSAVFSTFSVLFFYLIIKQFIKSQKIIYFSVLLFIFTPGLIQSAHFGTTESILILVFLVNIYYSIKILKNFKLKYLILSALMSGIGLATKISSLILISPIFLSLLFSFLKNKKILKFISNTFIFLSITFLIGLIFSPYNVLDFSKFKSSMIYEIGVANGNIPVFYTRQFIDSIPYLFQFQKIFPYVVGIPILILSVISIFMLLKSFLKHRFDTRLLLVLIPSLIYFLYQGQLFVKWTRFMSPIFFVFPFLVSILFSKIKKTTYLILLSTICLIPGVFFMKNYFLPDIRVQASEWINHFIPSRSRILSESGNVINLPLNQFDLEVNNFDFYKLDENIENKNQLQVLINDSDYIFIPSRRVFKNQNNSNFPNSQNYYQKLFSGNLDFKQIKDFYANNSFLLNSENAEETWSVFDNPTIRIFQKNNL